jgi:hypothetical protein
LIVGLYPQLSVDLYLQLIVDLYPQLIVGNVLFMLFAFSQ